MYTNIILRCTVIRTWFYFICSWAVALNMSNPSVNICDTKYKCRDTRKVHCNITFELGWVSSVDLSLEFDALLNSGTNTRPFSTVSRLLTPHLTNLTQIIWAQCPFGWWYIIFHKQKWIKEMNPMTLTWPFLRTWARLNFSLCLTLGFRSIFFLLGVSPLFLDIFSQNICD